MIKRLFSLPKYNLFQHTLFQRFSTQPNYPQIQSFSYLANKLEIISKISSRNAGIEQLEGIIEDYLQVENRELFFQMIRLLSCRVDSEEISIANQSIVEILEIVFPEENITKFLFEKGDVGLFAKEMLEKQIQKKKENNQEYKIKHMTIEEVIKFFEKLRSLQGDGSRLHKQELIINFFKNIEDPLEIQFFIRILTKSLRIGISDRSIIKALTNINKKKENTLDSLLKDIQQKIFGYNTGLDSNITAGIPIPPMLAKAISDYDSLIKFLKKFQNKKISLELKYDGERSQVHYSKELGVKLFSRNLESQNEKYPYLVEDLQRYFESKNISNCILDGEIIITDSTGIIKSFQEQQQNRKRKQDTDFKVNYDQDNIEKIYLFDAILINSKSLLEENQVSRKNYIQQYFPKQIPIDHAESRILDLSIEKDLEELKSVVKDYVDKKYEGAMVKSLDETTFYDTNGRTQWAKLKKQILTGGTADTFDVIPIAAYYGKGRRSGVYGAYLLACYDDKSGQYVALCKIGTGFSDKFLQETTERLNLKAVQEKPEEYYVHRTFKPDIWFEKDSEVWEVECDSLSTSPIYTIGKNEYGDRGISLRFPRFIIVRDDKTTKESTKVDDLIEFYKNQSHKQTNQKVSRTQHKKSEQLEEEEEEQ